MSSPHEEILVWWRWSFLQHQACRRRYWGIWKKTFQHFYSKLKLEAASRTSVNHMRHTTVGQCRRWQFVWLTWGTTWDQHHLWSSHWLSLFSLSKKTRHSYSRCSWNHFHKVTHTGVVFYLHVDEVVEGVDVLLYQPFHLENRISQ